jgi:hypothetical protein
MDSRCGQLVRHGRQLTPAEQFLHEVRGPCVDVGVIIDQVDKAFSHHGDPKRGLKAFELAWNALAHGRMSNSNHCSEPG